MESNNIEDIPLRKRKNRYYLYAAIIAIFVLPIIGFRGVDNGNGSLFLSDNGFLTQSSAQITAKETSFPEAPELLFINGSSLVAAMSPITVTPQVLGAIVGKMDSDIRADIARYIVEEEDTLTSIAAKFGVSTNTIMWANEMTSSSVTPGQELVILPITGTLHLVRPNDTLSEISSWYQASSEDIVDANGLSSAQEIFAGDLLVIPNGMKPKNLPQGRLTPLANSYFIYPIPSPYRVTYGLHAFNAIDFSNGVCGESIYAAAGGTIQKTGYTNLGGRYVRVLHSNGVVTYYGHMSTVLVRPGDRVLQGQIVGYTGYSGYTIPSGSAGCHLHFEVRGAVNPFGK